jgi:hypothetical protein
VIDWITVPRFCALTGYTDDAVRSKISQGVWREGTIWTKAPDNRVLISQIGYDLWVEGRESEASDLKQSRWTSGGKASAAGSAFGSSRPRLISSTPQG